MANEFIKAEQIVEAAVLLLQREIVLPRLVWTQPSASFVGALDDTITLRVPAVLDYRTRTMRASQPLVADELTETSVPVTLDTHVYNLLNVTDEQLTLDIRDFAAQVLAPQMRAVAEGLEDVIAGALVGATPASTLAMNPSDPLAVLIAARRVLNDLNVPRSGRVFLVGSAIEAELLSVESLQRANESGTTDALREAMLTRLFGFTIVGSNAIPPDDAWAFDRTAIAFANVAPALPDGAASKARVSTETLALRYLRDYNPTNSTGPVDRTLVDAFAGATSIEQDGVNKHLVHITLTGS